MACNGDSTTLPKAFSDLSGITGIPTMPTAMISLVTQGAIVSATSLYTPSADGLFRIAVYAKVTRAASGGTPSCALGGTTGLVLGYTDVDGVAQTITAVLGTEAGAAAKTNALNTTASKLQGDVYLHAKAGVAITYAFGYTSAGTTPMQYKLVLKVESL